jgi:hypothetical protein
VVDQGLIDGRDRTLAENWEGVNLEAAPPLRPMLGVAPTSFVDSQELLGGLFECDPLARLLGVEIA